MKFISIAIFLYFNQFARLKEKCHFFCSSRFSDVVVTQSDIVQATNTTSFSKEHSLSKKDDECYISCMSCKSVYVYKTIKDLENMISARGTRVKCSVCEKQWFQSFEKINKLDSLLSYQEINAEKAQEMRKFISDNNWARNPRGEKIDLFIGNLPFNYDEKDIGSVYFVN